MGKPTYDVDVRRVSVGDTNNQGHWLLRKKAGHDKHDYGAEHTSSHDRQVIERTIHGTSDSAEHAKVKSETKLVSK